MMDSENELDFKSFAEFAAFAGIEDPEIALRRDIQQIHDSDGTVNELRKRHGLPPASGCDVPISQNPLNREHTF